MADSCSPNIALPKYLRLILHYIWVKQDIIWHGYGMLWSITRLGCQTKPNNVCLGTGCSEISQIFMTYALFFIAVMWQLCQPFAKSPLNSESFSHLMRITQGCYWIFLLLSISISLGMLSYKVMTTTNLGHNQN